MDPDANARGQQKGNVDSIALPYLVLFHIFHHLAFTMSFETFITNSEDLDEKLSAIEFIKTLKKVESVDESKKGDHSNTSSASGSSDQITATKSEDNKKKLAEKKASGSELLIKMRSRFQHRATEPVFHTLANPPEAGVEQHSSSAGGRGSGNSLTLPQIELLEHTRRTDSAPNIRRSPHSKYLKEFSSNRDLSKL